MRVETGIEIGLLLALAAVMTATTAWAMGWI
jgi:hypothetical protein